MSDQVEIGFLSPVASDSPHFKDFVASIPSGINLSVEGLGLVRQSLLDLDGASDHIFRESIRAVSNHPEWQSIALLGAPVEIGSPGVAERIESSVEIPFTTAMRASAEAARAMNVTKVLLLTPFDDVLNSKIRERLALLGLDAVSPDSPFGSYRDAQGYGPDDVINFANQSLIENRNVEAIYFQGAVLDPIRVMDRMETQFHVPVIASNIAMLWHASSLVGGRFPFSGYGQLAEEWPVL